MTGPSWDPGNDPARLFGPGIGTGLEDHLLLHLVMPVQPDDAPGALDGAGSTRAFRRRGVLTAMGIVGKVKNETSPRRRVAARDPIAASGLKDAGLDALGLWAIAIASRRSMNPVPYIGRAERRQWTS